MGMSKTPRVCGKGGGRVVGHTGEPLIIPMHSQFSDFKRGQPNPCCHITWHFASFRLAFPNIHKGGIALVTGSSARATSLSSAPLGSMARRYVRKISRQSASLEFFYLTSGYALHLQVGWSAPSCFSCPALLPCQRSAVHAFGLMALV